MEGFKVVYIVIVHSLSLHWTTSQHVDVYYMNMLSGKTI